MESRVPNYTWLVRYSIVFFRRQFNSLRVPLIPLQSASDTFYFSTSVEFFSRKTHDRARLRRQGDKECERIISLTKERVSRDNVAPSDCNPGIFFARETTLSLTDNWTLIVSRFVPLSLPVFVSLSLCSRDRSSPLPRDTTLRSPSEIAGHSIYISVLFADKRVSMATISSAGGWNQSCFCSLHLSLASSLFLSLPRPSYSSLLPSSSLLPFFGSPPFLLARSSSFLRCNSVDWSGGPAAIMTSRGGEYAPH